MKTQIKLAFAFFMAFAGTAAFATPTYTGDVTAEYSENCHEGTMSCPTAYPTDPEDAGYWIWLDDGTWSIRWTAGSNTVHEFMGSILVQAGGGLVDSYAEVAWDGGTWTDTIDDSATFSEELVTWTAYATLGYDGIDFAISNLVTQIEFDLYSSLWQGNFAGTDTGDEADGQMIYIGDTMATPMIELTRPHGRDLQSFEISVPEPGTLALLGLGLMGMGISRRKAKA